jgi:hypothetical protein
MKTFDSLFDTPLWQAATALPPVAVPKVKPKQQSFPGFATGTAPTASALRREDLGLANVDILTFRTESDSRKMLAKLAKANPDLSAAVSAMLRVGLTQGYRAWALNMADGSFNREATLLAHNLLRRWDLVPNYVEEGFSQTSSIRSVGESLGLECLFNGAMCAELVLDKARLPSKIAPIAVANLKFYQDDKGLRPVQVVGGEEIDLDYPTVFYTSLDQPLTSAFANSPLEASIQPVLADTDYLNDLRRILKRAMMPRLMAKIDMELARKMAPIEAQNDPEAMRTFLDSLRSAVELTVNNLAPEDALVAFDMVEFSYVAGGTNDVPDVITVIQELLNAKLSTGAKTLPSVLGHGSGSQNTASSETLLFMKTADGVIRSKLNEMFSKILTLAVRLYGEDVAVYFEYDPIQLRPSDELEAFKAMEQSRVLEQLSLGFLEDDMASILLTRRVTSGAFRPLSGTQFYNAKPGGEGENPYSGTSNGGAGGGAMNQSLKSTAPKKAGGKSQ